MFKLLKLSISSCAALMGIIFNSHGYATTSVPLNHFLDGSVVEAKRNHQLCFSYEDKSPGLPCNPAFLGIRREEQFWIYGFGNNNLEYFQDVADIINGPIKTEELLPIVDHNSNEHFQLGSSVGFVANNWGVNLVPSKLMLFTHIRNPALPRITVLTSREEEAQVQIGSFINHEWSWGLQWRGVHRRFSYSDAYFSDHFTDDMDSLYDVKNQYASYIEPSLLYAPEDVDWSPQFSAMVTNLGNADIDFEPYSFDPNIRLGAAISNDLEYGQLQMGVTGQWLTQNEQNKIYSGLGVGYSLAHFQLFSTLSELEQQLGLAFNSRFFTTAIIYAEQDWNRIPTSTSTSSSQWRWDLGFFF